MLPFGCGVNVHKYVALGKHILSPTSSASASLVRQLTLGISLTLALCCVGALPSSVRTNTAIERSLETERRREPSGEKASCVTVSVWAGSCAAAVQLLVRHSQMAACSGACAKALGSRSLSRSTRCMWPRPEQHPCMNSP